MVDGGCAGHLVWCIITNGVLNMRVQSFLAAVMALLQCGIFSSEPPQRLFDWDFKRKNDIALNKHDNNTCAKPSSPDLHSQSLCC